MKNQLEKSENHPTTKPINDFDLIQFSAGIQRNDSGQVWDPIRNKWLVQTPEEIVRLCVVYGLHEKMKISFRRMSVERTTAPAATYRFDIVVFDDQGSAHLLIECKSPEHSIIIDHFIQAGRYNDTIQAPYVMITNGLQSFIYDLKKGEFMLSISSCFSTNL